MRHSFSLVCFFVAAFIFASVKLIKWLLKRRTTDKENAIRIVIEQFGEIDMLQDEVNKTFPNATKQHIQKEIIIAVLCIIASLIGPAILIGAHFQPYFFVVPVQALLVAYLIQRFLISQVYYPMLAFVGFAAIYLYFLQFLTQLVGAPLTIELYLNQIFSLEWDRLTGGEGLFNYVTLHMFWYIVLIVQILSTKNFTALWKKLFQSSFQYWAMLLFAVFIARFQSSAEWSVLYLNVFLLYGFFQQLLSIQQLQVWKEKLLHLIMQRKI